MNCDWYVCFTPVKATMPGQNLLRIAIHQPGAAREIQFDRGHHVVGIDTAVRTLRLPR